MFSRKKDEQTRSAPKQGPESKATSSEVDLSAVLKGGMAASMVSQNVSQTFTKKEKEEREKKSNQLKPTVSPRGEEGGIGERKVSRGRFFGYVKEEAARTHRKAAADRATFLIHGWADSLEQWERMRKVLEDDFKHPVYLFAYPSLDNRSTVENQAVKFDVFLRERLKALQKKRENYLWNLEKEKFWDKFRAINDSVTMISATPEQVEKMITELEGLGKVLENYVAKHDLNGKQMASVRRNENRLNLRIAEVRLWLEILRGGDESSAEAKEKKEKLLQDHELKKKAILDEIADEEAQEKVEEEEEEKEEKESIDAAAEGVGLSAWMKEDIPDVLRSSAWGDFSREVAIVVFPPRVPGGGPTLNVLDENKKPIFSITDVQGVLAAEDSELHFMLRVVPLGDEKQETERLVGLAFASEEDSDRFTEKFFQPPPEGAVVPPSSQRPAAGMTDSASKVSISGARSRVLRTQESILGNSFRFNRTSFAEAMQKAKELQKEKEAAKRKRDGLVKIDILVYSTGGLIVRYFLKQYYWKHYNGIIDHVVMCAPANYGSPWARKGQEGIGKIWVGDKSFSNFLGTGEGLLTSLECPSPFLWDLAHGDSLIEDKPSYFTPEHIKTAIYQGGADYSGFKGSTRGDMFGTDGTVTITGAPMKMMHYRLHLCSSNTTPCTPERSHSDVTYRILDVFNHATIKLSIEERQDVFVLVKDFLATSSVEEFHRFQDRQNKENKELLGTGFNPGKLFIFRYDSSVWQSSSVKDRPPLIKFAFIPLTGVDVNSLTFGSEISIADVAPLTGPAATVAAEGMKGLSNFRRHSKDKAFNYIIINQTEAAQAISQLPQHCGSPAGLVVYAEGYPKYAKLVGCSAWENGFADHLAAYDHVVLFSVH